MSVRRSLLRALFVLLVVGAGYTNGEPSQAIQRSWQDDYEEIIKQIDKVRKRNDSYDPRFDSELLDAHALIWLTDRDPLDVELRRALALAKDLDADRTVLTNIRRKSQLLDPEAAENKPARKALYLEVRAERRKIALSNPLLDFDEILLTTGSPGGAHIQSHFYGRHWGNTRFLKLTDFKSDAPQVREVLKGIKVKEGRYDGQELKNGRFYTLDLSWDCSELLFDFCARKEPADYGDDSIFNPSHMTPDMTYNIFKLNLETMELRQLSDTMYNDSCPAWLPNGRIVFISDRRGAYVRCHPPGPPEKPFDKRTLHQPCATLYSMKADGSDIIPISWHETSETFPRVSNDGRIVYTRWDYVDREFHAGHHIWFCAPDGRNPRAPHGNYPMPHSADPEIMRKQKQAIGDGRMARPWAEYCIRPIPDSDKYIAVASVHHSSPKGQLILIDPSVNDDYGMSQVKRITGRWLPMEGMAERRPRGHESHYPHAWPWPLSEDYYLVSHVTGKSLVLLDRFGNRDVLLGQSTLFAVPRKQRRRPPVIPTVTFQGERAGLPGHKPATIAVMNVYESDFDWPEGTKIAALRIVQIFPRPWSSPFQRVGSSYMTGTINRMSLGTVPVERDGSAYFEAPVECEIYFQALDEDGLAIQSMRSGTYVHPGEQLTCVGCHEHKGKTLAASKRPSAMLRSPSKIETEVIGLEPISFYRHVQPVLKAKCVGCHHQGQGQSGFTQADYESLDPYAFYFHGSGGGSAPEHGGYRSTAGKFGARASRMGQALLGKEHQEFLRLNKFSVEDFKRVTLWLDLNSMQFGSSSIDPTDQAKQRAGEIVWPKLDFDINNRQRIEQESSLAGRCISGDFVAPPSYRVTGDAVTIGQAASITAAIAAKANRLP